MHWLRKLMGPKSKTGANKKRSADRRRVRLFLEVLESRVVPAITIQINTTYDTSGMFKDIAGDAISAEDVQRNLDVLQAAANDLAARLGDTLDAIPAPAGGNTWTAKFNNPSTGAAETITNLQVPADTLIIYVGGRTFTDPNQRGLGGPGGFSASGSQAWLDTVAGRGEPGALGPDAGKTDVGPWGGSIGFDKTFAGWFFNTNDAGILAGELDFYTVAQHEIGHLLGFVSGGDSWKNLVSGGNFTGAAAVAAFGGPVPVDAATGHWQNGTLFQGGPVAMDPSSDSGRRTAFTGLDFAALDDIGWELANNVPVPPPPPATIPITLNITRLLQVDNPDSAPFPFETDGDYYAKVFINGVEKTPPDGTAAITDDDFNPFLVGGWGWTENVPATLTSVPVHIEIWDEDDFLRFGDDQMDISPAGSKTSLDLSLDLVNGGWTGDLTFPSATALGNGDGDGNTQIDFTIAFVSKVSAGMQTNGGKLTVSGDQLQPDDDITIEKTSAGGVKVTLNGHVAEYAPGVLTEIIVNTGGGNNTIRVASNFDVVPITINGGGTDRLLFFGSPPASPVYTPDANGLPGYGKLTLGSEIITFTGLEFVDGVTPDATGLALGAVVIDENGVVTLTGTFIDPGSYSTHSVAINWGDGTSDPAVRLVLGARSFTLTHRYLDDNPTGTPSDSYTITATVTDNDNLSDSATTPVTVNNVAPQLQDVAVTAEIDEDGVVTLSGAIVDPGTLDTFTLLVDWGEGMPESFNYAAGTTSFSETHQYLDDNPTGTPEDTYTINLTLTDDDTGQDTATTSTLVKNVAPVITALASSSPSADKAEEGDLITLVGSFTDVGTLDTHTVTVDWNDGTVLSAVVTEAGGSGTFISQHAFASGGIYAVTATVRDDDTGEVVGTKTIFITGVGVQMLNGKLTLVVVGSNDDDNVVINQQTKGQYLVHASFLPKDRTISNPAIEAIEVVLCAGDDRATVASNINLPSVMDGGAGDDHLFGGSGANILIGGGDDDELVGGSARDILIGSLGADRLIGNGSDDILIAGTTSYDSGADDDKLANDGILLKLLSEWNSGRFYPVRVTNLRNGTGPILSGSGLSLTKGLTVFDDGDIDKLTGSAGSDWFLYDPSKDKLSDKKTGERTN